MEIIMQDLFVLFLLTTLGAFAVSMAFAIILMLEEIVRNFRDKR